MELKIDLKKFKINLKFKIDLKNWPKFGKYSERICALISHTLHILYE